VTGGKEPFYLAGQRLQLSGMSFKLFPGLGLECSFNATNAMLIPSSCSQLFELRANFFYNKHLSITVSKLLICSLGTFVEKLGQMFLKTDG